MAQSLTYSSIVTPKHFVKTLIGLWLFFTIIFGALSDWITGVIMPTPNDPKFDGFLYAGLYSGLMLSFFGVTWKYLNKRFPITRPNNLAIHGLVQVFNLVIGISLGTLISGLIHAAVFEMEYTAHGKSAVSLTLISMMCLIGMLSTSVIIYSAFYIQTTSEADRRNKESELNALRAQINPHFLFNSLNSIAALIRISPSEAESVTEDLADVFRYTLRASDRPLVCLKDELEIIRLYLNIEQARFKDRLNVEINAPVDLHSVALPVLTLQPLVENAVKHGISKKEGLHTITLDVERQAKTLQVSVSDTGPGFPHNDFLKLLENSTGTGLSNVFKRLQLHFGEEVDAAIASNTLVIRFPYTELGEHSHFESLKKQEYEGIPG